MTSSPASTKPESDQDQQIIRMRTPSSKFVFGLASPVARQQQLFLSEYLSDVVFQVGRTGQLMHAHKVIITVASEVFFAQFNGGFAESKQDNRENPVVIEDIEPATFTEVLRYIYCEKVNLSADNIMDIYYASQKYLLTGLNGVCENFLNTTVKEENVLKVFNGNRQYGLGKVDDLCLKIIRDNPIKCFQCNDFLTLSQPALELIAASRTMNCLKSQLCEAIQKWCKANDSKANFKPKLEALQCRKLSSFSEFRYATDVSTDLKIKVQQKLHLYGLGVFIGIKSESNIPASAVLTVTIEPWNVSVSKTVLLKEDLYVEEILFEKLIVTDECRIKVSVPNVFLSNSELFCLNAFKPVDTLGKLELTVTDMNLNGDQHPPRSQYSYGQPARQGTNCVAYILYNLDPSTASKRNANLSAFNFKDISFALTPFN